jgi:hypothetical protein
MTSTSPRALAPRPGVAIGETVSLSDCDWHEASLRIAAACASHARQLKLGEPRSLGHGDDS